MPKRFEMALVAQRIHGLPKSVVLIGCKLSLGRQMLQRFLFENRFITCDIVEDFGRKHHKPTINPISIAVWLLLKLPHHVIHAEINCAKASGRLDNSQGGVSATALMHRQ